MSREEHLAFGQRLPEMLLAQGAGLWPKGQDRDSWSSGTAHCPPSEGRFAASVLLIPTLDSGSRSLGLFPCSSSSPDLGHPVTSVCCVLTSSPYSFLLFPWVSAVVSPPPGSLP